jgi:hypothetical protein
LTQQNIITALLALIFVIGSILVINWRGVFAPDSEPTTVAVVETEVIENTPDSTNPTRTPNPIQTQEMAGTLTAVYAAITATAFKTPTLTPTPSDTPTPTIEPTATIEPTETTTPTVAPTPTPNIILPSFENFDNGVLPPELRQVSGGYIIQNVSGKSFLRSGLTSDGSDGFTCSVWEIGDKSLTNFFIEMDYGGTDRGWGLGAFKTDEFEINFGGNVRARLDNTNNKFVWEVSANTEWLEVERRWKYDLGDGQHIKFELHDDFKFITILDGGIWMDFVYPNYLATGPITIKLCNWAYVDNVRIDYLP